MAIGWSKYTYTVGVIDRRHKRPIMCASEYARERGLCVKEFLDSVTVIVRSCVCVISKMVNMNVPLGWLKVVVHSCGIFVGHVMFWEMIS